MRGSRHWGNSGEIEIFVRENPRRIEMWVDSRRVYTAVSRRIIIHNPLVSDRYSEGGAGEYINNNRFEEKP